MNEANHSSLICTADNFIMTVKNIDTINILYLFVPSIFHVPKLSFNFIFVGQLFELEYKLIFDFFGMHV
jgi:hypothetical protein